MMSPFFVPTNIVTISPCHAVSLIAVMIDNHSTVKYLIVCGERYKNVELGAVAGMLETQAEEPYKWQGVLSRTVTVMPETNTGMTLA